ncbi:MAG: hypothetical protein IID30_15110 [Planctomycetes bacterium]|nr:hypothetical protein [Planctomycetota bacterium]
MAQCEEDQILPFDGIAGDGFGKSCAIDGNVAIIGTAFADDIARPGAAYIYRFDGVSWNPEAKFQPEDVGDLDLFGSVVSIHGDVAVVGSDRDDDLGDDSGSVYVFRFNGQEWIEDGHLLAPDGVAGDRFGAAVDIYGDYIAIGAPKVSTVLDRAGAFYLFHYGDQGWEFLQKFNSPDSTARIQFGITLAIDDHHLVVGCRGTIVPGSWKGKAFVYQRFGDLWMHTRQLQPIDLHSNANFGATVDIDDDTMAISSPIMRSIYIFTLENNTWVERQSVKQPELRIRNKEFRNISLKDDLLVSVGLEHFDEGKPFVLFAFLYRHDPAQSLEEPWIFDRVLLSSNPLAAPTDAVATNGDIILAGNQDNFLDDTRAGSVYVFPGAIEMTDCNVNLVNDACEIFSGVSQDCNTNIIPDECELDCNGNSIPDECDIAAETSFDGNNNGLLDECDCPVRVPIQPEDPSDLLLRFHSLDISQDVAIVGSPDSHGNELRSGAALIYRRINGIWTQEARLVASDGKFGDEFGREVAIDGNTVAVCKDIWGGDYDGTVYIFQYREDTGQWVEKQIIPNPGNIAKFGIEVSISGNRLAVMHGWGAGFSGTVVSIYKYIENDDTWEFEDRVMMTSLWEVWHPQSILELHGDLLIGGSAGSGIGRTGAITIYRRHEEPDGTSHWQIEAKLTSPDSEVFDFFGMSAAIDDDIAVVGALYNENNQIRTGAAYVYEFDGESWQYTKKLLPDKLDRGKSFGMTTAVKREIIMVGAQADGRHGSLYRFRRIRNSDLTTDWESMAKVHFYDVERYEYVGWKMEADGDFAIISSIIHDTPRASVASGIHIVEGLLDSDRDGFSDSCDSCPETPNLDLGDADGDGLGDACDVFGDINNDGLINVTDLLLLLAAWGVCPDNVLLCLPDLNGNGIVNVSDLLLLLQAW